MSADGATKKDAAGTERKTMSPTEAAEIRFLNPKMLRFHKAGAVLRVTIEGERTVLKAVVARVFPLSRPGEYLSVRDGSNEEVGILRSLEGLDGESRGVVEEELSRRYFVPVIRRIRQVIERFGTVEWHVDTDRGPWRLTTRDLRDNVLRLGGGRYILSDVDENRYEVPDTSKLDSKSLGFLLRHL